jgi:large subunit ribosomal protein L6
VSRVGKKPIPITQGVTIEKSNGTVRVKGPKGELSVDIKPEISVTVNEQGVVLGRPSDSRQHKALHGLYRALIANMVQGVTQGYMKKLEIVGVGYRAEMKGKKLQLQLGYSHPILFSLPSEVNVETPQPTQIVVSGIDKQLVGQVAAKIRDMRPVEPYKGKGIKYEGEYVRRKAGKTAAAK